MTDLRPMAAHLLGSGYARLPEPLPEPLLESLTAAVDAQFAQPTSPFRVNARREVSRIDGILERDPVFLEALRSRPLLPALQALLGPEIEVARFRHNHATLNRAGDQTPRLHRDVQQWSRPVLNVFVYLEEASVERGATLVVPGSQNLLYSGPQPGGGGGTWADEHPEAQHLVGQELPVPMRRGGVLLMNALTFHSVGENLTSETRKSLVFACHSSDDLLSEDGESHLQIAGNRTFRGNTAQRVSGGLEVG